MSSLSLALANKITAAALSRSAETGYQPMAIVILDVAGDTVAVQREDGASMFRVDVALGKAWASIAMGSSSRALAQRAKDNPAFFISLASTAKGRFLAQTGAVLVLDDSGKVIGAAGASGGTGDEDEAICISGIEAAGLRHG